MIICLDERAQSMKRQVAEAVNVYTRWQQKLLCTQSKQGEADDRITSTGVVNSTSFYLLERSKVFTIYVYSFRGLLR